MSVTELVHELTPLERVDRLPTSQYLMMEVLAARYRCGEMAWTFPRRFRPTAERLKILGLADYKYGVGPGTILVWLTPDGREGSLLPGYVPPILKRESEVS